jgi:thioredoxin-like negative regulator of GroEL
MSNRIDSKFAHTTRRMAALFLLVSLAGAAPALAQRGGDRLAGLDGGALTVADLSQQDSIVVFWASWSPKCRDIVERLNRLHSQYSGSAQVVSVNFQEDAADIREFLRGKNLRPPVYLDAQGAFSRKHAVTDLPGLVIYRDGKVAYQGRLPEDMDSVIRRVLS